MDYNSKSDNNALCRPPREYVNNMIKQFKLKTSKPNNISAVIIGGLTKHLNEIKEIFNKEYINIDHYFSDRYAQENLSKEQEMVISKRKEILVNPKENSVIVKVRNNYGDNIFRLN